MRLLTAVGVAVLAIGISASLAQAQASPRGINPGYHLINQLVPPGVINAAPQSAQAQHDLAGLITQDPGPVSVHLTDSPVEQVLELLGTIGRFEVQFSQEVMELPPVTLHLDHVDYEVVFRAVLDRPDLGYIVIGDGTLVVYGS